MIYAGKRQIIDAYIGTKRVSKMYFGNALAYELPVYLVVCTFDNVTSDAPVSVNIGGSLSVTLTATSGNNVQSNSVVVTMGGVDVTSTAYNHSTKKVTIAEVTGDVTIAAIGRPYDAEVEYLQGDGTAYIDTGFKHDQDTRYVCQLALSSVATWSYPFGSFGGASGTNKLFTFGINSNKRITTYYGTGTSHAFSISASGTHTFDLNKNAHTVDETTYSFSTRTFESAYNTIIFGATQYTGDVSVSATVVKVYYFKIYDNGTLVRDFIPVRIGQTGYLYDKVGGTLYGNAAESGAFTYGNDV